MTKMTIPRLHAVGFGDAAARSVHSGAGTTGGTVSVWLRTCVCDQRRRSLCGRRPPVPDAPSKS